MIFEKNKIYEARLQVHEGDPYLCGNDAVNESTNWPIVQNYDDIIVPKDGRPGRLFWDMFLGSRFLVALLGKYLNIICEW